MSNRTNRQQQPHWPHKQRKKSQQASWHTMTIFMHVRRLTLPISATFRKIIIEEKRQRVMKKVNQYVMLMKLGQGSSSKVYLCCDVTTNQYFAAKTVRMCEKRHTSSGAVALEREIRIMRRFDHPNILKLHEVLHATELDLAYMILEWGNYGTLESAISNKINLSESVIASIFKQIIVGIQYLHVHGIVHRDIKPSNILLFSNGLVKVSDFGIGHSFQSADTVIGTPAYQAPEVIEDDGYGEEEDLIDPVKEDIWSLGVTLFQTVYKRLPVTGENLYEIANSIRTHPIEIPEGPSEPLRDLLRQMLKVRPQDRISPDGVAQHPFLCNAPHVTKLPIKPITPPSIDNTLKFNYITATTCDENYSFLKEFKSFSWSGPTGYEEDSTDSVDSPIVVPPNLILHNNPNLK